MNDLDILGTAVDISFVMVMLGVAFAFVRLVKGPSLPDRIVALDMMTTLIVSFCGLYAILADDTSSVDVAIVLALVGFLATVALARYVERRNGGDFPRLPNSAAKPEDKP
jgi:multicomponent Na+:H+ antiporter subunit F